MDLREIKTFNHKIIIGFEDLQENLENKIYRKLSEQEFYDLDFEILNIVNFSIKEMIISGINVICEIIITALCNVPKINKTIEITDFELRNGSVIYIIGRIQIIAKLQNTKQIKDIYKITINDIKLVYKNILCVASINTE